jgi:acetoin utilization deacetylase AcuC-like enzyme
MASLPLVLFHNTAAMADHIPPIGSRIPEIPARITDCQTYLQTTGIWDTCESHHLVTEPLSEAAITAEYGPHFLKTATAAADAGGDIYMSAGSWMAARIAAQAAIDAVEHVMSQESQTSAFALVRPPGHHCFDVPAGFCLMNNVALAAKAALAAAGGAQRRVAIVDWDYHFGDGTAETFVGNEQVMFISLHAAKTMDGWPTYPRSHLKGDALCEVTGGRSWNIQWPRDNADDAAWAYAFKQLLLPALRRFAPDLILVSAGFDAVRGDTLAGMQLTPRAFGCAAYALTEIGVPVVAVLEGGYNTTLLSESVGHTIRGLQRDPAYADWQLTEEVAPEHCRVVDHVCSLLGIE